MKVATEEALDAAAPMSTVQGEDGPLWRVTAKCQNCHEELHLDCEEKPGDVARAIAGQLAPRLIAGVMCDRCLAESEAAEERSQTQAAIRERRANSQLPAALHGFEFAQMVTEGGRAEAINAARTWAAESDSKGLCLFGGVGAGKTRLAATAAFLRLQRWPLVWVSMPILLAQLGAAFSDSARREAIQVLTGKGALVLDDLDKISPSEWARNQLFAAIDKRVQAGAPLLITTNLPPSSLGEKFGEPVMSRIVGYCRTLELPGRDQRLRFNYDGSEELDAAESEAAEHGLQDPEATE